MPAPRCWPHREQPACVSLQARAPAWAGRQAWGLHLRVAKLHRQAARLRCVAGLSGMLAGLKQAFKVDSWKTVCSQLCV